MPKRAKESNCSTIKATSDHYQDKCDGMKVLAVEACKESQSKLFEGKCS
jgi:hypothetical protein